MPAAVVRVLLAAEQRGDHAASYRLLSTPGRKRYPTTCATGERRSSQLPVDHGVHDARNAAATTVTALVVVEVRHKPGLDPFIGLSAARERQTWHGRRDRAGWLVDADPEVAYELPPDAAAAAAALQWARAVQACDQPKAMALQAVDELYGTSDRGGEALPVEGPITVGKVGAARRPARRRPT